MEIHISKRQIKSDELFAKGLNKLSLNLRKDFFNGRFTIRKNDIKKIANYNIPDGSIDDVEHLKQLIN